MTLRPLTTLRAALLLGLAAALVACSQPATNAATIVPPAATAPTATTSTAPSEPTAPATAAAAALPTMTPATVTPATVTPATVTPATVAPATVTPAPEAAAVPASPSFDPAQTQIALRRWADGFRQPLFVTHAGDDSGRVFVVEKPGRIQAVQDGVPALFLDITDRVRSTSNEQGLLGLAFPPNFAASGHFFVNYTDAEGSTVIARFSVDATNPAQADPTSEFLALRFAQPAANHNGGMIAFGPDGYLWIGTGDGGAANDRFGNGQNPATYLGKLLRLDVTSDPRAPYTIPADNPWVNADWNGTDVLDEVWAVGLRNPWRFSFDRATGDLWVADVGQNQHEEVNFTPAGSPGGINYGWPIMEASHCFQGSGCDSSGLTLPIAEYTHAGHCSVTGGYVYRGAAFPALNGVYFFGDYCSGAIWAAYPTAEGGWAAPQALASGITLSSFGEDQAGELYVTDLNDGAIYQLVTE